MFSRQRNRARRGYQPSCLDLESRSLLSTTPTSILSLLGSSSATVSNPSTVPTNGDTLPTGVAVVPRGFLVANNGDSTGTSGTGSTIERVNANGSLTQLFQGSSSLGLTGMGVMHKGYVFAGSEPSSGGSGSVLVINRFGKVVANLSNSKWIDGPNAVAVNDMGNKAQVFVANGGNGTITRLDVEIEHGNVKVTSAAVVATGYSTATGSNGMNGPTGLVFNPKNDTLYVASPGDNAVYAVSNAGNRTTSATLGTAVIQNDANLSNPTGLALAPGGNLLVSGDSPSGSSSVVAEYTSSGTFVDVLTVDSTASGVLAGLALKVEHGGIALATADQASDTVDLRQVKTGG